ncbi:hypothetical protein SASPL_100679 [Salvia splendens]|uniref:Solute carrier family 35 (UDP-sugar transporter), member A1/2/3 n=1 Tax=Salvia splendens TaxID=180675 RepID=A0A8X8YSM1_SALSN|nr:hypothetical protein SASPL_100679 [Salvia splendens]
MEYRRIKDQDKDEDSVHVDVESLRGKPHSGSPRALVGGSADRTKWKRKSIVTLALTILTSSQAILIVWSKRAGKYEYSVTTANFLVESLKCALSLAALARIWRNEGVTDDNRLSTTWDEVSVYPIPAALYLIKNLLQYYIFAYVDAPGYQILKNFNIISTGVLYRIILKRKLSEIQWAAFALLCAGCTTAQLNSNSDNVLQTPLQGWMMAIVMALLSGFAGVYTEAIIKKRPSRNINVQNFWLYVFGMIFNAITIVFQDFDAVVNKGFFHGYSFITVLMILNHALRLALKWHRCINGHEICRQHCEGKDLNLAARKKSFIMLLSPVINFWGKKLSRQGFSAGVRYISCNVIDGSRVYLPVWISSIPCLLSWFHCCFDLGVFTLHREGPEIVVAAAFSHIDVVSVKALIMLTDFGHQ